MQGYLCGSRQDVTVVDEQFRQLERELGLLLRRAQASSASIARDVHPDLEPAAYALLGLIAATPGVRASDLATTIGVGRGTMSASWPGWASSGWCRAGPTRTTTAASSSS